MSRIINRLVEASGGWEAFLYKTLREVVDKIGQTGFTDADNAVEDAQEILDAYEELDRLPEEASNEPKKVTCRKLRAVIVEDDQEDKPRVTPVIKTQKMESVVTYDEDAVEWKLEDLVLSPPARGVPNPRRERCRVHVDKDLGGSSGELPMPTGHKLVNRQALTVTTETGMVLGAAIAKPGEEGQIKSQNVSGHVSVSGRYRLVFTDITLGTALIQYDVVALPSKMTLKQYKMAVAGANKLSVEELCERLEHFGLVFEKCLCGKEDCFGWRIIDQAEAEANKAVPKSPMEIQARLQEGLEKQAQRAEELGVSKAPGLDNIEI